MARIVRWGAGLGLGAVWWWAVVRLALGEGSGVLEGAVAAGGWGLSVLPVHCAPRERATGALAAGRWPAAWRVGAVTRASPPVRPGDVGEVSGPSS
ncbi:hypothetical protein [Streptomyces lucensis]|nr:hypothetical protein [Streptomyces lucensis]